MIFCWILLFTFLSRSFPAIFRDFFDVLKVARIARIARIACCIRRRIDFRFEIAAGNFYGGVHRLGFFAGFFRIFFRIFQDC